MSVYIVTRKSDGAEVYRYDAASVQGADYPLDAYDHTEHNPEASQEPPAPKPWLITRRAFWARLPKPNLMAMQAILRSGSPALLAGRLGIHQVFVSDGPYVDLDDADTVAGISDLMTTSYPATIDFDGVTLPLRLTAEQGAAALGTAPTEREVYRG